MTLRFPIIWLTGNSGAGKTTLARGLEKFINEDMLLDHPLARRCIVLDGNDMRETISVDATFSPADRRTHNLRVARLAGHLQSRGFLIVVAVIAPFAAVRSEIDAICAPLWVYVQRSGLENDDKPYEEPSSPALVIHHDVLDEASALEKLRLFVLNS